MTSKFGCRSGLNSANLSMCYWVVGCGDILVRDLRGWLGSYITALIGLLFWRPGREIWPNGWIGAGKVMSNWFSVSWHVFRYLTYVWNHLTLITTKSHQQQRYFYTFIQGQSMLKINWLKLVCFSMYVICVVHARSTVYLTPRQFRMAIATLSLCSTWFVATSR